MSVPSRNPALFRLPDSLMRLWLPLLLLTIAVAARADALPESVDTDAPSDIMTLWVVGDVDVIAKGLNAVAMFFNGMGSGSPLVSHTAGARATATPHSGRMASSRLKP